MKLRRGDLVQKAKGTPFKNDAVVLYADMIGEEVYEYTVLVTRPCGRRQYKCYQPEELVPVSLDIKDYM